MTAAGSILDRVNPILVKEVRQSLRGRYFRVMFWLTLTVATLIGLVVVADAVASDRFERAGQYFFMCIFGCMSAAVQGFVPFAAYLSTSSEWDENTHDLLVLSDLRPRQIVAGKLLSALVQALLYYSTFGPFLVFAFLLNGVDLLSISVILAGSLAVCIGLSLVGIALATLARVRAVRGMLMAAFGAALVLAWTGSLGGAVAVVEEPQMLRDAEPRAVIVFFVTSALFVGFLFGTIAAARFAHDEENRSSGLRVLSSCVVLAAGFWGAWLHAQFGQHEFAWATQAMAAPFLFLMWVFFLTEKDTLGRRSAKYVTPRRWLALLSAPFLPGGGLGVLLFLVHCALALLGARFALAFGTVTRDDAWQTLAEVLVVYGYAFLFIAIPAGIASARGVFRTPRGRMMTRVLIVALVPLVIGAPTMMGLVLGDRLWMEMEHPFNPVWIMERIERSTNWSNVVVATLVLVALLAAVTLLLNARRTAAGVREVLAASDARRARQA